MRTTRFMQASVLLVGTLSSVMLSGCKNLEGVQGHVTSKVEDLKMAASGAVDSVQEDLDGLIRAGEQFRNTAEKAHDVYKEGAAVFGSGKDFLEQFTE